ncbi:MAG: TIGR01777 family oxidoreductase [Simkaniaceae bacterium]|nr:TIGR01777 family oxidoreductase [Simkaniaceae bacterium]
MTMHSYSHRIICPFPQKEVFRWHLTEGAFERSFLPSEEVEVKSKLARISHKFDLRHPSLQQHLLSASFRADGKGEPDRLSEQKSSVFYLKGWFFKHRWEVVIEKEIDSSTLKVIQKKGPFAHFQLKIEVRRGGGDSCELIEEAEFQMRFHWFLKRMRGARVKKRLKRFFEYKQDVLQSDLTQFSKYPCHHPLKVLIAGASGFVGRHLSAFLNSAGHEVMHLVRRAPIADNEVFWDPKTNECNLSLLEGIDAVINLSGSGIADHRWSSEVKDRIFSSRITATESLVMLIAQLHQKPSVFLSASAVGFYGDHADEFVDESSYRKGRLFLSQVSEEWERAVHKLDIHPIRIVNLRFAMILSSGQGALRKMLPVFRFGLGSILGSGKQYMSWVTIDDAVAAIYHCLMNDSMKGPVNIAAPEPVTNEVFSYQLAQMLHRSLGPRIPAHLVAWLFGQMGEELFLTSTRAVSKKLDHTGFVFRYPTLNQAFRHLL